MISNKYCVLLIALASGISAQFSDYGLSSAGKYSLRIDYAKELFEKYFHLHFTMMSNIYFSETCTGTYNRNGCPYLAWRPPPNTKCTSECYGKKGRWGDSWCYTENDKTQWGAPCEKCYPENKGKELMQKWTLS